MRAPLYKPSRFDQQTRRRDGDADRGALLMIGLVCLPFLVAAGLLVVWAG
jgi:hypothetical protein